jgi:alpha-tubulin suppressor-like RCC1 family protein
MRMQARSIAHVLPRRRSSRTFPTRAGHRGKLDGMRPGALSITAFVVATAALAHCNAYDRARYGELTDGAMRDATSDGARDGDAFAADVRNPNDAIDAIGDVDGTTDTGSDVVTTDSGRDVVTTDTGTDVVVEAGSDTGPCMPSVEICNGLDDDCDGTADDGFDLATDPANCGSCGHTCLLAHSAPMCTAGACVPTCVPGWADCDGDSANGCEADLSQPAHCGRCDHTCSGAGATCDARGACADEYAAEIHASGHTTCARRINGTVWCWGNNSEGAVGDGTLMDRASPVQVAGIANAVAISGSFHHVCALRSDHTLWCWGSNESGALGDGTNTMRTTPVQVSGLTDAMDVEAGRHHVCAHRIAGAITCWGRNFEMELADGTTTSRYAPVATMGTDGITQLGSYGYATCGLSGGSVLCWGRNTYGEMGNGTMVSPQGTPGPVSGLTDAAEVQMGYTFACARRTNGHVICWGANAAGEIGDGTRGSTLRLAPTTEVTGITDAIASSVGDAHACALRADRTLVCWGNNGSGEIGDGTTTLRTTPVSVRGLSNVAQVSVGDDHACALLADGTVTCWGANSQGQLGDGTTVLHLAPAPVVGIP